MATRRYSDSGGFGWAEPELQVEDKTAAPALVTGATRLDETTLRAVAGQRPSARSVQLARGSALELGMSAALRVTLNEGLRAAWGSLLRTGLRPNTLSIGPHWFVPSLLRFTGAR